MGPPSLPRTRQLGLREYVAHEELARCIELTGLCYGATYTLSRGRTAQLGAYSGFAHPEPLDDFFGHPELLGEALAIAQGRVMRLFSAVIDPLRAGSVLARAGLAVIVLVPIARAGAEQEVLVLGTPRDAPLHPPEDPGHTARVSRYCRLLAELAGVPSVAAHLLGRAAALHDVGKLTVPESVLMKPGPLTAAERVLVERHAADGHRILSGRPQPLADLAASIAFTHHEHWDGSGYPRRLRGREIPLEGRIAAVADVFDALTSDRPYRSALSIEDALELMAAGAGSHFEPTLLRRFLGALPQLRQLRDGRPLCAEASRGTRAERPVALSA